jgi:hypothetical protein
MNMRLAPVLALVACHQALPEGFPAAFSDCAHSLGESQNFVVVADGTFKWAYDGCDYNRIGRGTWDVEGQEVVLHPKVDSTFESPWGDSGDARASWDGQHVVLSSDGGVSHFAAGSLCGSCQLNGGCLACSTPPSL